MNVSMIRTVWLACVLAVLGLVLQFPRTSFAVTVLDLRASVPGSVLNTVNAPVTTNNEQVGTWLDQSPADNDATAADAFPQWRDASNNGPALRFHQGNSNMVIDEPLITSTSQFRIDARVNYEDNGGINGLERYIAGNYGLGNLTGLEFMVYLQRASVYVGYANVTVQGATILTPGTWYDLAVERNAGTYNLYVNGVLDGSSNVGWGTFGGGLNFSIGGAPDFSPERLGLMSSITVEVPEPASAASVALVCAAGLRVRGRRRF